MRIQPNFPRRPTIGLLIGLVLAIAGCSGSSQGRNVEVSGQVTVDGEPLTNASIRFVSQRSGASFSADLDSSGKFSMPLIDVREGDVMEVAFGPAEAVTGEPQLDEAGIPVGNPPPAIPKRYFETTTSDLSVTMTAQAQQSFPFTLARK